MHFTPYTRRVWVPNCDLSLSPSVAMEEPTVLPPTQNPQPPNPEGVESTAPAAGHQTKKRKLENGAFQNTTYFKILAIIQDLRPFFVEVTRAPDFRNSKAAQNIKEQMKIMIEFSKQLKNEAVSSDNPKKPSEEQPLGGAGAGEEPTGKHQAKQAASRPKTSESPGLSANVPEKVVVSEKTLSLADKIAGTTKEETIPAMKEVGKQLEEGTQQTYVVGGSPIGWNFLVFPGSNPVYYGVTKASFRSSQTA